jgi:hypothetical protein
MKKPTPPERAQNRQTSPPPLPGAKASRPQPRPAAPAQSKGAAPPPGANRNPTGPAATVQQPGTVPPPLRRRGRLQKIPLWIWPSLVGVALVGFVTWTLLTTGQRARQAVVAQGDAPSLEPAKPGNSAAGEARDNKTKDPADSPKTGPSMTGPPVASTAPPENAKSDGSSNGIRNGKRTPKSSAEEQAATSAFFNGADLTGWDAPKGGWRVEGGALVGAVSPTDKVLAVLCSKEKHKDFDLRFRVRLKGGTGNCIVRFRATRDDAGAVGDTGAQCVIQPAATAKGETIGSLVDQTTDVREVVAASSKAASFVKAGDFNRVHVRCEGKTVIVRVNGIMTACKTLAAIPDDGVIVLELDGRQQAGEVTFKDFKFKDLKPAATAPNVARAGAKDDDLLKAEADYRQSLEAAKKKLVSAFDSVLQQRLSQSSQPDGKHTGIVAALEHEKDAFLKKGQIPWSRNMRAATFDYLGEMEQAQQKLEQALTQASVAASARTDGVTSESLRALGDNILSPHLVATATFAGTKLSFRSDGIVEKSDEDAPRRWWLSPGKHDDVIVELADDADSDNAAKQVFHILDNGKSLTETTDAARHEWVFVDK